MATSPLTADQIRQAFTAGGVIANSWDERFGESQCQSLVDDTRHALAGRALWRLLPCIEELHRRILDAGRTEGGPPECRAALLDVKGETAIGLSLAGASGATWDVRLERRTETIGNEATRIEQLAVVRRPTEAEMAAMSPGLCHRVQTQDPFSVSTARVDVMYFSGEGGDYIGLSGRGRSDAALFTLADDLRPLLAFAEAKTERDINLINPLVRMLPAALALDGGLPGGFCRDIFATLDDAALVTVARGRAATFASNIRIMHQQGLTVTGTRLAYSDTDKRLAAIPCRDHRKWAQFHENIDLAGDINRFAIILTLGEDGRPAALSGFDLRRAGDTDPAVTGLPTVELIARGLDTPNAAMPNPVFTIDLVEGRLTRGPRYSESPLPDYLGHIARNDHFILTALFKTGQKPDFGVQRYHGDSVHGGDDDAADPDASLPMP